MLSRHNRRMSVLFKKDRLDFELLRKLISHAALLDIHLKQLGADQSREIVNLGDDWPNHLQWGVDSVFVASRLLFSGQLIGAAAIARVQLERWTDNLIFNAKLERLDGESRAAQISRAWALARSSSRPTGDTARRAPTSDSPQIAGNEDPTSWTSDDTTNDDSDGFNQSTEIPIEVVPGRLIMPGLIFSGLSELLHARGPILQSVKWETCDLLGTDERQSSAYLKSTEMVIDALTLSLSRIRACIMTLAIERNNRNMTSGAVVNMWIPSGRESPWGGSLIPMAPHHGLRDDFRVIYESAETSYRKVLQGKRPAGHLYNNVEFTDLAFLSRRSRAYSTARHALKEEEEQLGIEFNIAGLDARMSGYILVAEAASLCSLWLPHTKPANAAAVASSALRSASWLWLEDDDRAMGLLRVVLEQTARLKTWRRKPTLAENLERSRRTTPRDWLEAAGWKRLRIVGRALGETVHMHPMSRWFGAHAVLVASHTADGEDPVLQTGRRSTLDMIALMLARESVDWIGVLSAELAQSLEKITALDKSYVLVEEWLSRSWDIRATSFGEPMFQPHQDDEEKKNSRMDY